LKVPDFARASLGVTVDTHIKPPTTASHEPPYSLNSPRILLESVCRVTDSRDGRTRLFAHGASCKTEKVGVPRDIWLVPNADFVPIFSEDDVLVLKTYARQGESVDLWPAGRGAQNEILQTPRAEAFSASFIEVADVDGELLPDARAIVNASLAGDRLVVRTTLTQGPLTAAIDYPVKTMNANNRDWVYQTDTGPHLVPDLSRDANDLLAGMRLAFSAFNGPDWIEFLLRVPTRITEDVLVWHYSQSLRADVRNEVFRIP
jgi:hypothetical protein